MGGKLSLKELRCGVQADSNKNGKIDPEEIDQFEKCIGIKGKKPIKKISNTFDVDFDRNGKVQDIERQFAKLFDLNNDGMLSKQERDRAVTAWKLAKQHFDAIPVNTIPIKKENGQKLEIEEIWNEDEIYSEKEQLTAFLLSFFLGGVGAGRFYVGDYAIASMKLCLPLIVCILAGIAGCILNEEDDDESTEDSS